MEIKIDDSNLDNNVSNYWDTPKPKETKKKVKFGYDDILSNINLVVNNGVLQYMTPVTNPQQQPEQYLPNNYNNSYNNLNRQNQNQNQTQTQSQNQTKKLNVDPTVKNSAIYNKYFKNYKDPNEEMREVRTPKTKEEFVKMLIEDHNNRIDAQKRLAQVKSKKMFFFGPEGSDHRNISASQNKEPFNKLFQFK